jgi:hypothetical protein
MMQTNRVQAKLKTPKEHLRALKTKKKGHGIRAQLLQRGLQPRRPKSLTLVMKRIHQRVGKKRRKMKWMLKLGEEWNCESAWPK